MITFSQYLAEMTHDAFGAIRLALRSPFKNRGFILVTPAHAGDRAVEGERGKDVTERYLSDALQAFLRACDRRDETIERVKQQAPNAKYGVQITIRHAVEDTFINIPAVIAWSNRSFTLTLKTIMVKRNFVSYPNDIIINV
jgi:hypothetical protein